ncbi:MAG: insulinase family protein [Spirochaetaceae bacterium]|jgi:Zn-dependent M16 (insulinase) family peptidase|nr:insulinase family protein [Spirochaetaceae bacterium]
MKTTLKSGDTLAGGFEIIEVKELEELQALGIWARHKASGAEVFHILNDDSENLFAFAFKTPPADSTGAAHILEHSVLCGSKNYPLKDAFIVLAQGSLQTFLNAMTYPDKTVYPASSTNEHDYFNLMAVYGDAVFRPLLAEWTFQQEGHRLFFTPLGTPGPQEPQGQSQGGARLEISGVVYNEMKGAYSSLENTAGHWSVASVLPDTVYAHDSGGNPKNIPELSWEELKKFHRAYYAPANCRIFLAGNIPTEKQLAFLNDKFLSELEPGRAAPAITRAKAWDSPQSLVIPCPAGGGEQKATVFLSWRCADSRDTGETLALAALAEALLGHDGSPLTMALIESHLGEDIAPASGLESELRESVFTIGLRGVDQENKAKVGPFILAELSRLCKEGIPGQEIEAALLAMEFSHREIRRSGGPYSLVWLRRSLRSWLHGGKPWDSLLFAPNFSALKAKLSGAATEDRASKKEGFFEGLIEKYLINNPHRALVFVEPDETLLPKEEALLAARLDEKARSMSGAERNAVIEQAEKLEAVQGTKDRKEDLAAIPHLSRSELDTAVEEIPRRFYDVSGIPVMAHPLFTNGISYLDFALPLDIFAPEQYPWFPLYARAAVSLGLPGMDYGKVSSLLARTAGDFHAMLETGSLAPGMAQSLATPSGILELGGRDWLVYRLKALDEKIEEAVELACAIITEADFGDTGRLEDLIAEMKNDIDSSLAPQGHLYTGGIAARLFSRSRAIDEIWNGLDQLAFVHGLDKTGPDAAGKTCLSIQDALRKNGGLLVNITGSDAAIEKSMKALEKRFPQMGPPRPRKAESVPAENFHFGGASAPGGGTSGLGGGALGAFPASGVSGAAVFASPSLQVGFAALALPGTAYASREQSAELILSHLLSTGALWEDIRMRGGAYGAFANPDRMERVFIMASYRDPSPLRSLDAFRSILKKTAETPIDAGELEKIVIGAYSKETRPKTNAEKGSVDFFRWLYGIENRFLQVKLKDFTGLSGKEVQEAARRLVSVIDQGRAAVLSGRDGAEKTAAQLGVKATELPA